MDNRIRFKVIGSEQGISGEILDRIASLEAETRDFDAMTLIVFFNYSGKWDIMQAAEKFACRKSAMGASGASGDVSDKEIFESCLSTYGIPDPDLLIRTSGEKRLSNFMLWQCAYTEFYFADVFWPDFREKDWALALDSYSNRDRRYGKIK